jgi:hypothetical protein
VCLASLGLLIGQTAGIFGMQWRVLGSAAACLLVIGICIALEKNWAVLVGRVALWPLAIIAAFMVVPDREDAIRAGDPGLQWQFAVLAGYLLVCIVLIARVQKPPPTTECAK